VKGPSLAERYAAHIVGMATNCICEPLEPGGPGTSAPRFELLDTRGERTGTLDVATTMPVGHAFFAAANDGVKLGDSRLRFDWRVVIQEASADFGRLARVLPTLLVQAECEGYAPVAPEVLVPGWTFPEDEEPQVSLQRAGVHMISAAPAADRSGVVHVSPPPGGGVVGPSLVTDAVHGVLQLPGTVERLRAIDGAARRELFIWLFGEDGASLTAPRGAPHSGQGTAQGKAEEERRLSAGPSLPEPVTRVWVATEPDDRYTLARALWVSEAGGWEVREPPARLAAVTI